GHSSMWDNADLSRNKLLVDSSHQHSAGQRGDVMTTQSAMRSGDRSAEDLHGNAPDRSETVLLLVDVINDLNFPQNEKVVRESQKLSRCIARLKERCKQAGIPTIYVNDNFGKWRSDFSEVVRHCLRPDAPGRSMVEVLLPEQQDYVVLKPKHSAFYATPLDTLLEYIGAKNVILAGITTNACVMITAGDVHIRDFGLFVPSDCVAALTEEDQVKALEIMERNFDANTTPAEQLDLSALS
ncbi:MAG: cysteine hydrolase family protein, partial [Bryobacteraceae bacterium]